jgi:hypothetical protein
LAAFKIQIYLTRAAPLPRLVFLGERHVINRD